MNDKLILRARDFWTSITLIFVSCFFIYKTSDIPFLNTQVAGVDSADWYNSAALVPYAIFVTLLLLSLALLRISIKDGGARHALSAVGIGLSEAELMRVACISVILFSYLFGLLPRVDFILASALMITCLIWGFHRENKLVMLLCTGGIATAALYAAINHFPRSQWAKPHDDDWVTLIIFCLLTLLMFAFEKKQGRISRAFKVTPLVSIFTPLILVSAMAFGFRQNVPNRTGLLFSQIEYHYYVSLKPLFRGNK